MNTVEDLITDLTALPEFINEIVEFTMEDKSEDIEDFNRTQLQQKGVDAFGKALGDYAQSTIREREKRGLQTSYVDLKFTGKFQNDIELNKKSDLTYDLTSGDVKWQSGELSDKYPEAIGLTDENEDRLTELIIKNIEFRLDKIFCE